MANTTPIDYMAILKSVAKVEDDKYEYMVSADDCVEAMKKAVEEAIPIILNHCYENSRTRHDLINQSEPLKKILGI